MLDCTAFTVSSASMKSIPKKQSVSSGTSEGTDVTVESLLLSKCRSNRDGWPWCPLLISWLRVALRPHHREGEAGPVTGLRRHVLGGVGEGVEGSPDLVLQLRLHQSQHRCYLQSSKNSMLEQVS